MFSNHPSFPHFPLNDSIEKKWTLVATNAEVFCTVLTQCNVKTTFASWQTSSKTSEFLGSSEFLRSSDSRAGIFGKITYRNSHFFSGWVGSSCCFLGKKRKIYQLITNINTETTRMKEKLKKQQVKRNRQFHKSRSL